jgi:hypothetical protein
MVTIFMEMALISLLGLLQASSLDQSTDLSKSNIELQTIKTLRIARKYRLKLSVVQRQKTGLKRLKILTSNWIK